MNSMQPGSTAPACIEETEYSHRSHDPIERFCSERLLLTERDSLIPLLRTIRPTSFAHPTCCTGWTIRDMLAHCAAALTRIAENRLHDFSPACNQQDIVERHDWPVNLIIDELETGYVNAGPTITASSGRLDVIALGEWVHAGDIRDALGIVPAYAAAGTNDALTLLSACSRLRNTPLLTAHLADRDLQLGTWLPHQRTRASLTTDTETLVRLYTGRVAGSRAYTLHGAASEDLVIYR
jgi:uncharacterized protein (TIGR03083 family)